MKGDPVLIILKFRSALKNTCAKHTCLRVRKRCTYNQTNWIRTSLLIEYRAYGVYNNRCVTIAWTAFIFKINIIYILLLCVYRFLFANCRVLATLFFSPLYTSILKIEAVSHSKLYYVYTRLHCNIFLKIRFLIVNA